MERLPNPARRAMLAASTMALLPLRGRAAARVDILNVSYDPTRELYKNFNAAFARHWTEQEGGDIGIRMSHGGSGAQARSVIDGLNADVVTLALAYDIDAIAAAGRLARDWQARLPDNSTPYTCTIVFLVRKGNPKQIKDWGDLTRPGVQVITPNPKTSGGARWNFLAACAWALNERWRREGAGISCAICSKNVPVLDTGARGATITFTQRGIGDVLMAWENEAFLSIAGSQAGHIRDRGALSLSILAEPPVAVVDRSWTGTAPGNWPRPTWNISIRRKARRSRPEFLPPAPATRCCAEICSTVPDGRNCAPSTQFGGWTKAQQRFFADGGIFDQIYRPARLSDGRCRKPVGRGASPACCPASGRASG